MQLATSFPGLLPVQSQGYSAPAADWFLFRCWRFSAKRMLKRCFHSHWASCSLCVFAPWPCSTATLLHLFQCCCPICAACGRCLPHPCQNTPDAIFLSFTAIRPHIQKISPALNKRGRFFIYRRDCFSCRRLSLMFLICSSVMSVTPFSLA